VTPGSGFGLGAKYRKTDLAGGRVEVQVGAQGTLLHYKRYQASVRLPEFSGGLFTIEVNGTHRDHPREAFHGLGIDSESNARTDYRLKDTDVSAVLKVHVRPWLTAGLRGGMMDTGVSRGADPRFEAAEDGFPESEIPGVRARTRYKLFSAFARADTRDHQGKPRSGSLFSASVTSYNDRKPARFSFTEYQAEARHYISFVNKRRVVALRGVVSATSTRADQEVPFFMQPRIGGSNDVRGYADSRFYDRNSAVFNAEYRWELLSGLDMAVFGDAGQVAKSLSDFRLNKFKTTYGLGLRISSAQSVVLRADLGFSRHEGRRLSLNFGHVF
jgi:outer membrane protein assembly factor BamA